MKKILFFILLAAVVTACQFKKDEWVDFTDIEAAKGLSFKVMSQRETDLSDGLPADCYLPGGMSLTEAAHISPASAESPLYLDERAEYTQTDADGITMNRTNSLTIANIMQELLKYGNQNRVIEIAGKYLSFDADWNRVELSGKVILPKGRRPKRMILVSHYTVGSNAEAPSNCFSIEGVLVKMGYGLIIPDYLGYGVTADKIHPYLVMMNTAISVVDMYLAVRPWLEAVGMAPEEDDIYLMGYSQGGAVTMAVQYLIEVGYSEESDKDNYIKIHRVFAGGGPYDVKATYERFVNTDTTSYPVAVPLVLQGMIRGYGLNIKMSDMMQEWLLNNMDEWVNSKKYTTGQINGLIDTSVTHKMLTKEAMDQTSVKVSELYKAMTTNSIISYDWSPKASVYMMHSMDDETVPYTNATNAKAKWKDSNITFNFGHYGGHVATFLRFVYSVQTLLEQEERELNLYK